MVLQEKQEEEVQQQQQPEEEQREAPWARPAWNHSEAAP